MKYKIALFGGDAVLLDDTQYQNILRLWDSGMEEFVINGRRISRKAIAMIGFTENAADEMRVEEQNYERTLGPEETEKLREAKYQQARLASSKKNTLMLEGVKERVWKGLDRQAITVALPNKERRSLPMSATEDERGDAMYWVDEDGIKHYE